MNLIYFLCALLSVALAKPEGYYQQQYQYRSSSSSFKNNELQRKTDDEGFYAKHGDLAGRVEPKVNAYTQHTDYVNPNLQNTPVDFNGHHTGGLSKQELAQRAEDSFTQFGASNLGLSSSNQYGSSSSGYTRGSNYGTSGTGSYGLDLGHGQQGADDVHGSTSGRRNQYSYSGSYSVSSGNLNRIRGGDYDIQSNLGHLTQQLQDNLSRELQSAILRHRQTSSSQSHYVSSSSGSSASYDSELQALEQELRANLTRELQESLQKQYGTQGKRGSYSYSITSGTYNPKPNYNNQELVDLTAQVEDNLIQQLRENLKAVYDQTSYSTSGSNRQQTSYHDNTYSRRDQNVVYKPFSNYDTSSSTYGSQSYASSSADRTPVVNPLIRLVDVVQPVQNELDLQLNDALNDLERRYLISEVYTYDRPDYDIILQNLKNELLRNLTMILNKALYKSYGTQEQRGSYIFSTRRISSGEQIANYKYDDLENLKKQVEDNLIQKLTQTISDQRNRYMARIRHSLVSYETRENEYTENRPSETQTDDDRLYTSYATFQPSRQTSESQTRYHSQSAYGSTGQTSYGHRPSSHDQQLNKTQAQTGQQTQFQYSYNPTSDYQPLGSKPSSIDQSKPVYGHYQPSSQSNSDTSYRYVSGSRQSGVEYTTGNVRSDADQQLQNIQQELQNDLSRQVQNAISQYRTQGSYISSSSSSSLSSSANNQVVNDLSEELKRNLTQKLEELLQQHYGRQGIRGGYSYSITTGGNIDSKANYNNQQLAELTAQLQEQLLQQLHEGLAKQSYQYSSASYKPIVAHGSYSSGVSSYGTRYVSGSRQYGATRSFGTSGYGQSTLGTDSLLGEDRMQGDDNFTNHKNLHQISKEESKPNRGDIPQKTGNSEELTQQTVDTQKLVDFNQHTEDVEQKTQINEISNSQTEQRTDDQQVGLEVGPEIEDVILQTHEQKPNIFHGQRVEDHSQQTEDNFGHVLEQQSSAIDAQQTDDGFGKLIIGSQQTIDDQQTEDGYGKFIISDHSDDQSTQTHYDNGISRQTEDLTQQTEDLGQHTQELIQQEKYLTQQQEDITQQQEDLIHQNHDTIQQSTAYETPIGSLNSYGPRYYQTRGYTIGLDRGLQNRDITQQTVLTQQSHFPNVPVYYQAENEQITQQSEDLSQNAEDLSQHTQSLSQQTENLSQQSEELSQHAVALSQQTQGLPQHAVGLSQQTEGLPQYAVGLSQQTEGLSQHTVDLTQQTGLSQHAVGLAQQTEDVSQHSDHLSQQTVNLGHEEDLTQQTAGLTQQQLELIRQSQSNGYSEGAHYNVNYSNQTSVQSSSSSSNSQQSQTYFSSSHPRINYATLQQVSLDTTGDLEQQQVELQRGHVVQDVSPQAQSPVKFFGSSSSSSSNSTSSSSSSSRSSYSSYSNSTQSVIPLDHQVEGVETIAKIEQTEPTSTTEEPGFWKRLGSKISQTYKTAKENISEKIG